MFTSRAEYRILLRQDNADTRLTPLAERLGVTGAAERMERVTAKLRATQEIERFFRNTSVSPDQMNGYLDTHGSAPMRQANKLHTLLVRPHIHIDDLRSVLPELDQFLMAYEPTFVQAAEISMKYAGYIRKEEEMVEKMSRLESVRLHEDTNYQQLVSLSAEAREKLTQIKPRTIGQASRISGVSPADISVLLVHMGR